MLFDALSINNKTWVDPLRQLGENWSIMDTTKSFCSRHIVSAQDDKDKWKDDMIHYKEGTYLVLEATYSEMDIWVIHDTSLERHFMDVYDDEVLQVVELLHRRVPRLQVLFECFAKNRDSRFLCAVW